MLGRMDVMQKSTLSIKYNLPPRLFYRLVIFLGGGGGGVKREAPLAKKVKTRSYHRFLVMLGHNIGLATGVCACGHLWLHHGKRKIPMMQLILLWQREGPWLVKCVFDEWWPWERRWRMEMNIPYSSINECGCCVWEQG